MTWIGTRGEEYQGNSIKHAWYNRGADLIHDQAVFGDFYQRCTLFIARFEHEAPTIRVVLESRMGREPISLSIEIQHAQPKYPEFRHN